MRAARHARQIALAAVLVPALAGVGLGLAGQAATAAVSASAPVPVLTAITATHHPGHDQLVFRFVGGVPARRTLRYLSRLPANGTATPVSAAGPAMLLVSFSHATGLNGQGQAAYGPAQRSFALPGVIQVVTVKDHPHVVRFGVGVARREPFRMVVLSHPSRVVIDVRAPYRTAETGVFFVNSRRVFGTAVTRETGRPVIRPATATRALQRLFAGPTQAELAAGLRLVTSGATGFSRATVHHGVARVYLTGGCRSAGSTVTVATEIVPTLRQLPTVQWVKIYDPAGNTQQPAGDINSIPACLKPSTVKAVAAKAQGSVLLALVILAGLGVVLGLVLSAASIVTGLARRPNLITPAAYRAERIKASPVATGQFEPDLAWPFYPLRQVRADLGRIEAQRQTIYGKLWRWRVPPIVWILLAPLSAAVAICLLVAGLTTLVIAGLFAVVIWACAGIALAVFAPAVALLRGAERTWRTSKRTEASCPRCYHVTPWPAYRCPGCSELHRDIRPGRLGLLARRCTCGALLPTMVLRAAWRLEAVCQRCGEPLQAGSAAVRDVRIPIFGDTSAGKTRFLYAGLDTLIDFTSRAHIPLGFPDEESQNEATIALDLIRSGQETVKTSRTLPTALTCRIGTGVNATLVHLFDAAGEYFRDAQAHDSLGFLDHGHGLVYVLDPFSVGRVRDRVAGQNAAAVRFAHAAAGDPETAYGEVVSRLRDSGVGASGQRLAIVVSKADLLSAGGLEPPADSDAIAEWLMAAGVHNLVLSARREFAEVRYFAVASLAAGQARRSHDPGAPLRWLLTARGVRLPAESAAAGSTDRPRTGNGSHRGDRVGAGHRRTARAQR